MASNRSIRQGRIHFRKVENPYPLEMIQQGLEALSFLSIFPALTSWQVCRLLFLDRPNKDGAPRNEAAARRATNRECLRRLKDLGLVGVKPIARLDNPLTKWELNYLTREGHRVLSQHRQNHGLETLPFRPPASLTYETMNPHTMAVIDVGVSAFAAAARSHIKIETWLDDLTIRSLSKRKELTWPMEPDFVLVLVYGEQRIVLMGEVDRGTEDVESSKPNSMSSKIERYKRFYASERQDDPWLKDLTQPHTFFVFDSPRRLQNVMEMVARHGGRSSYHFALSTHLHPPYSFFGEVWQRIGLEGYHAIPRLFVS